MTTFWSCDQRCCRMATTLSGRRQESQHSANRRFGCALLGKLRFFAAANVISRAKEVMRRIAETYNVLWYAKIPPGSHLTEMLALICQLPCARKRKRAALLGRKQFSAGLTVCHPGRPCFDSFRTQSAHWILCLT